MTEPYKYFAYKDRNYWNGHILLTYPQIRSNLEAFNWKKEVFTTIQTYDVFGTCLSSPLYFDFDGDPIQVMADVKHVVQSCEYNLNVTPKIFFSGNKGFHLIIDFIIEHPLCHLVALDFATEIGGLCKTLDKSVYRTMAMFRVVNSPASIPGHYKIPITRAELFTMSFDGIKSLATKQRLIPQDHDIDKIDQNAINQWMFNAITNLPVFKNVDHVIHHYSSLSLEMTPCIRTILETEQPQGQRHECLFLLIRFLKLCGLDATSSETLILSYKHWKDYEDSERELTKILRSVYGSRIEAKVGCKTKSYSAEIMRSYCQDNCWFNPNFPKLTVTDCKGKTVDV